MPRTRIKPPERPTYLVIDPVINSAHNTAKAIVFVRAVLLLTAMTMLWEVYCCGEQCGGRKWERKGYRRKRLNGNRKGTGEKGERIQKRVQEKKGERIQKRVRRSVSCMVRIRTML